MGRVQGVAVQPRPYDPSGDEKERPVSEDLAARVRARLDEIAAAAQAALEAAPVPWKLQYDQDGDDRWLDIEAADGTAVIDTETGANGPPVEVAEHFALHDPAAVLADVASKRKLLDSHRDYTGVCPRCFDWQNKPVEREPFPCEVVRLLAEGLGLEVGDE
jgi:hypothetical protein